MEKATMPMMGASAAREEDQLASLLRMVSDPSAAEDRLKSFRDAREAAQKAQAEAERAIERAAEAMADLEIREQGLAKRETAILTKELAVDQAKQALAQRRREFEAEVKAKLERIEEQKAKLDTLQQQASDTAANASAEVAQGTKAQEGGEQA